MYNDYSKKRIRLLKNLHIIGYSLEIISYFFIEIWTGFHQAFFDSPFAVDPIFYTIAWTFICLLGGIMLLLLFEDRKYSIDLITDKTFWLFYPVYVCLAMYFIGKEFKNTISGYVIILLSLSLTNIMVYCVYFKTKQLRYKKKLSFFEYLSGKVFVSVLLAFVFLDLVRVVIEVIFNSSGGTNFLGWSGNNWVMLLMILVFGVGVVFLTIFQDFWFSWTISFYFFGMYACQKRFLCRYDKNTCSNTIQIACLALGSIMIGFIVITKIISKKKYNSND